MGMYCNPRPQSTTHVVRLGLGLRLLPQILRQNREANGGCTRCTISETICRVLNAFLFFVCFVWVQGVECILYRIDEEIRSCALAIPFSFVVCSCSLACFTYVYMCTYIYIYAHIYIYVYTHIYVWVRVYLSLYRVLQCVAVCCSVLQCVAVCCSVWHCVAVCCIVLQSVAFSHVPP